MLLALSSCLTLPEWNALRQVNSAIVAIHRSSINYIFLVSDS